MSSSQVSFPLRAFPNSVTKHTLLFIKVQALSPASGPTSCVVTLVVCSLEASAKSLNVSNGGMELTDPTPKNV